MTVDVSATPRQSEGTLFDADHVGRVRKDLRLEPGYVRKLRTAFFKHAQTPEQALESLPLETREAFAERVRFSVLEFDQRFDSRVDGATRLIFRTQNDGLDRESCLRAATGRVSLCISSQVGCAAACDFCATGRMGIAQNLTSEEILDQVAQANRLLREEERRVRNIVFMGMGEPFHNEEHLHRSLETLTQSDAFHHSPTRILISTVGITDTLLRTAKRFPQVNYAISLHATDQSTRESLIPLAKRYPLTDVRSCIQELNHLQSERTTVMIEYLMLQGINDSPKQAEQLLKWIKDLRVHINLIPYNQVAEAPHLEGSSRQSIETFGDILRSTGQPTTIRYSMGHDIEAACGQLVQHENRQVAKQHSVRRSS